MPIFITLTLKYATISERNIPVILTRQNAIKLVESIQTKVNREKRAKHVFIWFILATVKYINNV